MADEDQPDIATYPASPGATDPLRLATVWRGPDAGGDARVWLRLLDACSADPGDGVAAELAVAPLIAAGAAQSRPEIAVVALPGGASGVVVAYLELHDARYSLRAQLFLAQADCSGGKTECRCWGTTCLGAYWPSGAAIAPVTVGPVAVDDDGDGTLLGTTDCRVGAGESCTVRHFDLVALPGASGEYRFALAWSQDLSGYHMDMWTFLQAFGALPATETVATLSPSPRRLELLAGSAADSWESSPALAHLPGTNPGRLAVAWHHLVPGTGSDIGIAVYDVADAATAPWAPAAQSSLLDLNQDTGRFDCTVSDWDPALAVGAAGDPSGGGPSMVFVAWDANAVTCTWWPPESGDGYDVYLYGLAYANGALAFAGAPPVHGRVNEDYHFYMTEHPLDPYLTVQLYQGAPVLAAREDSFVIGWQHVGYDIHAADPETSPYVEQIWHQQFRLSENGTDVGIYWHLPFDAPQVAQADAALAPLPPGALASGPGFGQSQFVAAWTTRDEDGEDAGRGAEINVGVYCGNNSAPCGCELTYTSCEADGRPFCGEVPAGCGYTPDCGGCPDGNTCGGAGEPNRCGCSTGDLCADGDPCHAGTCGEDGLCLQTVRADGEPCEDGNPCTTAACSAGVCVVTGGCDDGDLCTTDECEEGVGCTHTPVDCDDADACTEDACDEGVCANVPLSCDDGDACTVDTCDQEDGCAHAAFDCDDADDCTIDVCTPSGCLNQPFCGGELEVGLDGPETVYVGGYAQFAVTMPPGIPLDEIRFRVVEGPQGGEISYSRDDEFDPANPTIMVLGGWLLGTYTIEAYQTAEVGGIPVQIVLGTLDYELTADWDDPLEGPPRWRKSAPLTSAAFALAERNCWEDPDTGLQNVGVYSQMEEGLPPGAGTPFASPRRVVLIFVDFDEGDPTAPVRHAQFPPEGSVGMQEIEDYWRDIVERGTDWPTGNSGLVADGTLRSLDAYFRELSGGGIEVEVRQVLGPYRIDGEFAHYLDNDGLYQKAVSVATEKYRSDTGLTLHFSQQDHVLVVLPRWLAEACTIAGDGREVCNGIDDDCDGLTDMYDRLSAAGLATCGIGTCGDGWLLPPEECDDMNTDGTDGCSNCEVTGVGCDPAATEDCDGFDDDCDGLTDEQDGALDCGDKRCGDGVVQVGDHAGDPGEACDAGDADDWDADECSAECAAQRTRSVPITRGPIKTITTADGDVKIGCILMNSLDTVNRLAHEFTHNLRACDQYVNVPKRTRADYWHIMDQYESMSSLTLGTMLGHGWIDPHDVVSFSTAMLGTSTLNEDVRLLPINTVAQGGGIANIPWAAGEDVHAGIELRVGTCWNLYLEYRLPPLGHVSDIRHGRRDHIATDTYCCDVTGVCTWREACRPGENGAVECCDSGGLCRLRAACDVGEAERVRCCDAAGECELRARPCPAGNTEAPISPGWLVVTDHMTQVAGYEAVARPGVLLADIGDPDKPASWVGGTFPSSVLDNFTIDDEPHHPLPLPRNTVDTYLYGQSKQLTVSLKSADSSGATVNVRVDDLDGDRADLSIRKWTMPAYKSPDIRLENAKSIADEDGWGDIPQLDENNTVIATVTNEGQQDATDVAVEFMVRNLTAGEAGNWVSVGLRTADIAVGETVDVRCEDCWKPTGSGAANPHFCVRADIQGYVDPATGEEEYSHLNNSARTNYAKVWSEVRSPAHRVLQNVTVSNPFDRDAIFLLEVEQTNASFRTYLEHEWVRLGPNEERTVRVMYEYAEDLVAEMKAGREVLSNHVAIRGMAQLADCDPDAESCDAVPQSGAHVEVVPGFGTDVTGRVSEKTLGVLEISGEVTSAAPPALGGPSAGRVFVAIRYGDDRAPRYVSAPVSADGSYFVEVVESGPWTEVGLEYLGASGFAPSGALALAR